MNKIRIEVMSKKEIAIYKIIRDNFDLAVDFAREHLGYYISMVKQKNALKHIFYHNAGHIPTAL